MDLAAIKTEIGLLLTEMQNEPKDASEAALILHDKLNELRAYGMPLPEDLVELEATLDQLLERRRFGLQ